MEDVKKVKLLGELLVAARSSVINAKNMNDDKVQEEELVKLKAVLVMVLGRDGTDEELSELNAHFKLKKKSEKYAVGAETQAALKAFVEKKS